MLGLYPLDNIYNLSIKNLMVLGKKLSLPHSKHAPLVVHVNNGFMVGSIVQELLHVNQYLYW